ncbi:MAG: glycosyltransferase family 39 protein [Bacteroidota bacterium]|nr:glycosyltransferase family 39 protein [Bacteroidota bacterium]
MATLSFGAILPIYSRILGELIISPTANNDVAFLFYVSASIWAWLKYIKSGKFYWIVFIGAFAGAAILCKWLSGLLVYLAWGIYNMQRYQFSVKKYLPLLISLLITALVVLPWQFLIFTWHPAEAKYELNYNFRHFSEVIEGHSGNIWYHFDNMKLLFGRFIQVLILPALAVFYIKSNDKKLALSFLAMPIFVYLLYSLSATKMPSYPILVAIPIYVCIAYLIYVIYELLSKKISIKWLPVAVAGLLLLAIAWSNLRILEFSRIHAKDTDRARQLMHNKSIFISLNSQLPDNTIIFNVKGRHYVDCMFYTNYTAYNFIPSETQYASLKALNIPIAIFKAERLPAHLLTDEELIIIDKELMGYN